MSVLYPMRLQKVSSFDTIQKEAAISTASMPGWPRLAAEEKTDGDQGLWMSVIFGGHIHMTFRDKDREQVQI